MIWIGRLISVAVILQSIEALFIRPWPWDVVACEFPPGLRTFVRDLRPLLWLRILAASAALIWPNWIAAAVLVLTSWLLAWRWRGTLNGGSDAMTMQILLSWFVALRFPALERICVSYVAIQIVLSYFVAGAAKLVRREWRDGRALGAFFQHYEITPLPAPLFFSWCVILFEISFPLALVAPWPFIAFGALFHLLNAYFFGLNRFFFAWLAGYPAIFLLVSWLHL